MAKLDSLIVDLQANTAGLRKGLDEAMGLFNKLGKEVSKAGKEIHEMTEMKVVEWGADIAKEFAEFVNKGAEAAEMAGKMAQSVGMPVETFSRLSYAANLSNVSTEDFAKSLEKLDRNLAEAGAGSAKQGALFQALGVKVKDAEGNVRGTEAVLGDLADTFAGMQDGADKTALAMEVFGKSGAAMIPFLNEGRDGLAELSAEADRLGITISGSTAAAATAFEDDLKKLKLAGQAVAAHVAGELTPMLTNLTHQLLDSKEGADLLKDAVTFLAGAFKVVVSAGIIVKGIFELVGKELAGLAATVVALVQGDFKGALRTYADMGGELEKEVKGDMAALSAVWSDHTQTVEKESGKQENAVKKNASAVMQHFKTLEKAPELYKQGMEALTRVLEEYGKKSADIAGGGKDPLAEIQYRLSQGDLAKDLAKIGDKADEMKAKILAAAAALQKLEVGNLKVQLNFDAKMSGQALDHSVEQRKQAFGLAGGSDAAKFSANTQGFQDFNDAITKYADAVKEKTQWENQAKVAEKKGDIEAMQGALEFAQSAGFAAEKANNAAEAFAQAQQRESEFVGGLKVLGGAFTSKLGQLGQTINDAIQGFQQGGIWGALAALIMDLLSMMDGWKEIQNIAQGQLMTALKEMSSGLGGIISALKPLMGAIGMIAHAIHGILNPILLLIGNILKGIAPLFAAIGVTLQVLNPIIDVVCRIIGSVLTPILQILDPILSMVAESFLATELAIEYVVLGFDMFVGWIDHFFGGNNDDAIAADWKAISDTQQQMADIMNKGLSGVATDGADAAEALGATADQSKKTTTAMAAMTAQLTNVPAGIRIALNRYNSSAPGGTATVLGSGNQARDHVTIQHAYFQVGDYDDLYKKLLAKHELSQSQNGGPPPH